MSTPPPSPQKGSASRTIVVGIAVLAGFLGPTLTLPSDRAAGTDFAWDPPPGFTPSEIPPAASHPGTAPMKAWTLASSTSRRPPHATLTHTDKKGAMDKAQLADIARGMPDVFKASGVTWSSVKNQAHKRPDGALVGVLFGDCKRDDDGTTYRSLQIAFPDDRGTSILTASYVPEEEKDVEPALLDTIDRAKGVAVRLPSPPAWMYLAWAAGGLVAGFVIVQVLARRKQASA